MGCCLSATVSDGCLQCPCNESLDAGMEVLVPSKQNEFMSSRPPLVQVSELIKDHSALLTQLAARQAEVSRLTETGGAVGEAMAAAEKARAQVGLLLVLH